MENKTMFTIVKDLNTTSWEIMPEGSISIKHTQTPQTHNKLTSLEDLRFFILIISGILNTGSIIAAIVPITFNICMHDSPYSFL